MWDKQLLAQTTEDLLYLNTYGSQIFHSSSIKILCDIHYVVTLFTVWGLLPHAVLPTEWLFTPCSLVTLSLTRSSGPALLACLLCGSGMLCWPLRVSVGMRFSFVNVSDKLLFLFQVFFSQGKTPSPRAAHACATVGNRGFVFGGRYRVSRSPTERCATKTQMECFNHALLCCRSPEWTTFTIWIWILGSGMKCRY